MFKIAIDAGHGSNTAGKRTPPFPYDIPEYGIKKGEQFREHIANVGVAVLLEEELQRCGFKTIRVGWNDANAHDDIDTPLTERQRIIKNAKCDISISVHFNAYGDGRTFNTAEGVGVYIHDKYANDSKALATQVLKQLVQGTKQKNRGVTAQALALCNCKNTGTQASILLELAFMTNLHEATNLFVNPKFWKECAIEIARGVCAYTKVPYVLEGTKIPKRVTRTSPKEDIVWLQTKLRQLVEGYKVKVTGVYDAPTRIALLMYWEQLGWGRHMNDDGTVAGNATCTALAQNRKE